MHEGVQSLHAYLIKGVLNADNGVFSTQVFIQLTKLLTCQLLLSTWVFEVLCDHKKSLYE
jgi:hypothetical protein